MTVSVYCYHPGCTPILCTFEVHGEKGSEIFLQAGRQGQMIQMIASATPAGWLLSTWFSRYFHINRKMDFIRLFNIYRIYKSWKLLPQPVERRWWVHPVIQDRHEHGFFAANYEKMLENPERFIQLTRMDPGTFRGLLNRIANKLQKFSPRQSLTPTFRLYLTLM